MSVISVAGLAARLRSPGLCIIDARAVLADPQAGFAQFQAGHIPGAVFADLNADLSAGKTDARLGRHPLPDSVRFAEVLSRLGVTPETELVVYDQSDGAMAASRFWLLMRLAGHAKVSVLDGGMDAWRAAGLPVDDDVAAVAPTVYPVLFNDRMLVNENQLKSLMQTKGAAVLIDARAPERFRGDLEPIDKKAGHIPGALNRPYTQNLAGGAFKPAEQLRSEFSALMHGETDILLSCGSGVTACHNALALSMAGYENWRLFAPGWSGWVADDGNPVAQGG